VDAERGGFATTSLLAGVFLIAAGALHHRGFHGSAGPTGVEMAVPADPTIDYAERETQPSPQAIRDDETDDVARWYLAQRLLDDLALPEAPFDDWRVQVWLIDAEGVLGGIHSPDRQGGSTFEVGQGAVGQAWEKHEYVIAEGEAVRDATFGLSEEQQRRYADLAVAAAIPIDNAAGRMIGVLSAASREPCSSLSRPDGFEHLVFLSQVAARIMVDVLKWFPDE